MKKLFAILLVVSMMFSFVACGQESKESSDNTLDIMYQEALAAINDKKYEDAFVLLNTIEKAGGHKDSKELLLLVESLTTPLNDENEEDKHSDKKESNTVAVAKDSSTTKKEVTDNKQQATDTKPEEKINVEKKKFNPADLDGLSYSEIAERIKTVEELDEWLIYRNYGATDPAHDWHFAYGGISDWSVNRPAEKVLDVNSGNCGGGSNLFCYMLNGDYDEIGYIWRRDSGGGHVMNYVLSNGVYTWYDVTALVTFEEDKPAEARHIRVFNKSTDIFATAKKYALSVDNGWKNHNSDMYIRSIYFIKCINGEPHTPIYSVPVQSGDVLAIISCNPSLVTEVYVREDDAQNNGAIVKDYNIPTSAYPKKMYQ